jgi:type 1 glutamine amidotransferase
LRFAVLGSLNAGTENRKLATGTELEAGSLKLEKDFVMHRNPRVILALVLVVVGTIAAAAALSAQGTTAPPEARKGRTIEVLFLGHNSTHHDSARFEPMLAKAIESEGFHFTYTPDPNQLNTENLAKYDALMIYANHTTITPEQEKALLDFVASGKGFLPIHCASFCFQNSPAYIALVGAQFLKHGTGEFTATIVQPNHPILDGVQPFQVWDETYVHTKINPDKTVLMERVDDSGHEPWTWVREQGKGRVFYTAYGHDERVWGHPMFQRLVRNGILWAVGPSVRTEWAAGSRK